MTYFLAFLVAISSSPSAFLLPDPSPSWTEQNRKEQKVGLCEGSALPTGEDVQYDKTFGYVTNAFL